MIKQQETSTNRTTRSWLEKLTTLLMMREPQNKHDLLSMLRGFVDKKILDNDAFGMIEGVLRYTDLQVRDIMIPRSQAVCIPSIVDQAILLETIKDKGHSRYPVYHEEIDNILGILHAKDLFSLMPDSDNIFQLNDVIRPATVVPESKHLNILLSEFKREKNHMAVVVDEYGGVSGFVTIEDIIEQIVGNIDDEFDSDDDSMIHAHSDNRFVIKAHLPIQEFNRFFDLHFSNEHYDTLGGALVRAHHRIPEVGEVITVEDHPFKVLNADNRRLKLIEYIRPTQANINSD